MDEFILAAPSVAEHYINLYATQCVLVYIFNCYGKAMTDNKQWPSEPYA